MNFDTAWSCVFRLDRRLIFFSLRVVRQPGEKLAVEGWTSNKVILANEMVRDRVVYFPDPLHKIQMLSRERRLHSSCRSSIRVLPARRNPRARRVHRVWGASHRNESRLVVWGCVFDRFIVV